jgi:hypothetical protein
VTQSIISIPSATLSSNARPRTSRSRRITTFRQERLQKRLHFIPVTVRYPQPLRCALLTIDGLFARQVLSGIVD